MAFFFPARPWANPVAVLFSPPRSPHFGFRNGGKQGGQREEKYDQHPYNQRGIRSYEKAGFILEGRERQMILREGRRWDVLFMGILREDWIKLQRQ